MNELQKEFNIKHEHTRIYRICCGIVPDLS